MKTIDLITRLMMLAALIFTIVANIFQGWTIDALNQRIVLLEMDQEARRSPGHVHHFFGSKRDQPSRFSQ